MEEALASSMPRFEGGGLAVWDVTAQGVVAALDGLAMRADVRAHNVANVETPGFRARHVDFESALADALRRGEPARASAEVVPAPAIVDHRGNSVDLATELVGSMRDGLHRDLMIAAFNFKTGQLRVAFGGQR